MTGGDATRRLDLCKTIPVDSGLCRLVAFFGNSYERILIGEILCQNLKPVLSNRSTK